MTGVDPSVLNIFSSFTKEKVFQERFEAIINRLQKDLLVLKKENLVDFDDYALYCRTKERAKGLEIFISYFRKSGEEGWTDERVMTYHSLDQKTFRALWEKGLLEFIEQYRAFDTDTDDIIPW